ncbi:MAG: DUF2723 domain-containing protein, partial [bacterium]
MSTHLFLSAKYGFLEMVSLFPFFIFFVSFSSYLFTAFPSIYWRDASEFQAIGYLLDIAHPAGSPLYAIIAKGITFIPIGSIAFKITLVSSIFGAMLSVLFYYIVLSILRILFQKMREDTSLNWIGLITTIFFSFSNAVWENSNRAEVYTFQNFFTAIFILTLLNFPPFISATSNLYQRSFRFFFSIAFLYGLSLGAHAIIVLYLPFLFFWLYFSWLKPKGAWVSYKTIKYLFLLFFFFIIGFSVYLYLPIRSSQNPHYDWGNPETFENFIYHT